MNTQIKSQLSYFVLLTVLFIGFQLPSTAEAKLFKNSYVSFELPNKWSCYLENTAWICRYAISKKCLGKNSTSKSCQGQRKKTKEAIIILAAKEKGPKDSLKAYYNHLKTPRPIITKKGKKSASKIVHVKPINIERQKWVDGMHEGSEIPHYYTRYLATVKGNIAVLVTFSAHKLFYTKYSKDFFKAIKSLRVLATKAQTVTRRRKGPDKGILGGNSIDVGAALDDIDTDFDGDGTAGGSTTETFLLLGAAILALLGIFIWLKGRR